MAEGRQGDVAMVEGRLAIFMPHRWEWMDGTWTAIPLKTGPVLFNVYDKAAEMVDDDLQDCEHGFARFSCTSCGPSANNRSEVES